MRAVGSLVSGIGLALAMTACGEATEPEDRGDARDDSFLVMSGGADQLAPEDNSAEARAILEVVNTYSTHSLVREVDLYWNASKHIVDYRNGEDGIRNTDDDRFLWSMGELDAIPYVGKKSLALLRDFVRANDLIEKHDIEYSDSIPTRIKTTRGAAFRGVLRTREVLYVRLDAQMGDRIIMWLRKAGTTQWNPKLKIVDSDTGETVAWANPWGNTDARLPESTEEAARGWEVDREPANYSIALDNTGKVDGEFEFLLECIGGPCYEASHPDAMILDGNFGDLEDDELRWQMVARHEATHTYLDYYAVRKIMFEDLDNEDGQVECVYTGEVVRTNKIPDNSVMNAEHTWPQSKGAVEGAARSDLHHLFPIVSTVNSTRAAYPYCDVVETIRELGPARYGLDKNGERCFEPRDEHKGNAARAMFYFAAVYQQSIDDREEEVLRAWHELDPVNQAERSRNSRIEDIQGSRNPFVDDPGLVGRIADF